MNSPQFIIQRLDPAVHHRELFECESEPLTRFLRERARKEMDVKASVCFVLVEGTRPDRIVGYYTLAAATIALAKVPVELARRWPRYEELPATLLGRLARDNGWRGKNVGNLLLGDALKRAWLSSFEVGSIAVVTDPKDARAMKFYEKFGFRALDDRRWFLPISEIGKSLAK